MQNTSTRNNSIKMEVILFASLYRAIEVLIFYVHFFIEELSIYVARQRWCSLSFIWKRFRRRKFRGPIQTFSKSMYGTRPWCLVQAINRHTCPDPHFASWNCLPHQAHIALSEKMSSIHEQGSSLDSFPTFRSPLSPL